MKPIDLNDLPQYSKWISELLGDKNSKRLKNQQQIDREYGLEKWGSLLAKWKNDPCGVDVVRSWELPAESVFAGLIGNQLMLMTPAESLDYYVNLVEQALLDDPSEHLVEIGCGYGSVLFGLLKRGGINYGSVMGLEYTTQGMELAKNLAVWHNYDVVIGQGDFNAPSISDLEIKPNSDIVTSFSLCCVHESVQALNNIIRLNPRRVLHFEPVFQHYREQTTLGLLQRRYMEINDYNSSLLQELNRLAEDGAIEIIKEVPSVFGSNCLLPASLLVWRPVK